MFLKEGDAAGSVADLTLNISGKSKLILNSATDYSDKLGHGFDPETFELDFHPGDQNSFVLSTEFGLFHSMISRKAKSDLFSEASMRRLDTSTLGTQNIVTSLSYSDQDFILAGFIDGSISIYHSEFSSPLSVWYNSCESSVKIL